MKNIFSLLFFVLISMICDCQDLSLYQKKWLVQGGDTMPYRILLPENYDSSKKYPLVFFLHGAGERGNDNEAQLVHGGKLFLKEEVRKNFPAIVIFPQCAQESYWSNVLRSFDSTRTIKHYFLPGGEATNAMKLLQSLLKFILQGYPIRTEQVYVGGLSMGGMGTFELVRRCPGIFAAAFPICGGAAVETVTTMDKISWWIFHGGKDDIVSPLFSARMAQALQQSKVDVKYTVYPEANHNSWDAAFSEPELFTWLFAQKRKP